MKKERAQEATEALLAFWSDSPPDDNKRFRACTQLARVVLNAMTPQKVRFVKQNPARYRNEIQRIIEQEVQHDVNVEALIATLGDNTTALTAQSNILRPADVHKPMEQALQGRPAFIQAVKKDAEDIDLVMRLSAGTPARIEWESVYSGTQVSKLALPFSEAKIPLILKALDAIQYPDHPLRGPRFSESEQQTLSQMGIWEDNRVAKSADQQVGQLLYQALIADTNARSVLDNARNMATEKDVALSLILRFAPEVVALASLPWELLWDERQPLLLRRSETSCVRYIDLPYAAPHHRTQTPPLRLLALCPTEGIPEEIHQAERKQREQALQALVDANLLVVEELRPVRRQDITDRIQDGPAIDILHFYGHGIWSQGAAHLQLDDGLLNARQLASLFGKIPLVVLHACRSGEAAVDNLFAGIAPMLSAEGVRAVVAMQFTIRVAAANRFASVLYRNLAQQESLQTALAKARQALYVEHTESWYVPVLYIRSRQRQPIYLLETKKQREG